MSLPALLLFIFAPVLGPLFAPLLSALVRVRAVAVLSALIVAASLSVAAPAWAEEGRKWRGFCETDEWDDTSKCNAHVRDAVFRKGTESSVFLVYQCLTGDDGKIRESVFLGEGWRHKRGFGVGEFRQFAPIESSKVESGDSVWASSYLAKLLIRWDKERASEGVFFKPKRRDIWFWQWGARPSDWRHWEKLKMTPTALPNPIRLLQTKSQLRMRGERSNGDSVVFTFSLAGAREAIAKAKRGCGL